jgi:hypothetical protein
LRAWSAGITRLTIIARILTACSEFDTKSNGPWVIKTYVASKMSKIDSERKEMKTLKMVIASLNWDISGKVFK